MNPPKFKAWSKQYGMSDPFHMFGEISFHNPHDGGMSAIFKPSESNVGWKLLQFLQIKDKNQKELCQSDIVKIECENKRIHGEWAYYEVTIVNGIPFIEFIQSEKEEGFPKGYIFAQLSSYIETDLKHFHYAKDYQITALEIVGNIYENPELLTEAYK